MDPFLSAYRGGLEAEVWGRTFHSPAALEIMGPVRLKDKAAIVTGAGSGIGKATALRFAREGARVIAADIRGDSVAALAEEAAAEGRTIAPFEADVTREADAERLAGAAVERFGGLDILVNNAGIVIHGTVADTSEEDFQRTIDVNLKGVFLCSKYAVRQMRRRGGGSIVNVSSINGIRGNHFHAAYCASKGGVVSLTYAMAIDHAAEGIRVNCVCPAATQETGMVDLAFRKAEDPEAFRKMLVAKHPLGRLATREEVVAAILFLASDEASFLTGVVLPVDGGRSIR